MPDRLPSVGFTQLHGRRLTLATACAMMAFFAAILGQVSRYGNARPRGIHQLRIPDHRGGTHSLHPYLAILGEAGRRRVRLFGLNRSMEWMVRNGGIWVAICPFGEAESLFKRVKWANSAAILRRATISPHADLIQAPQGLMRLQGVVRGIAD